MFAHEAQWEEALPLSWGRVARLDGERPLHARGSLVLKDGTPVTLALIDEDAPSPDSVDALAAEDDASKAR